MARTEVEKWNIGQFPYDRAKCKHCASWHQTFPGMCQIPAHAPMVAAAKKLDLRGLLDTGDDKKIRRAFLSFRKKFARFYPANKGSK